MNRGVKGGVKNDKRVRTTRKEEDMQTFRLAGGEKLRRERENTGSGEEVIDWKGRGGDNQEDPEVTGELVEG